MGVKIAHAALVNRSEEKADLFFRDLLGLEKADPKILSANLAGEIFNVEADITVCNYTGPGIRFEVFITTRQPPPSHPFPHICLQVQDREAFLIRCENTGAEILRFPKGDKVVIFIKDFSGNLFEIV